MFRSNWIRASALFIMPYTVLFASTFSSLEAFSQVYYEQPYKESVILPYCSDSKLCDLRSFSIFMQDYKIVFSPKDISFGTRMFSEYETETPQDLENYGVVQFIKGCQFNSRIVHDDVEYIYNISRQFFDETVPYVHKKWQIDSVDTDPMYNNTPEEFKEEWKTRHGMYRWNRTEGSYEQSGEVLYYKEKPTVPRLYVTDHPGTAFLKGGVAKNISLQFKTCLYRTSEIPEITTGDEIDFAKPLHCFEWASSYIYDYKKNDFIKTSQLHSACQ